MTDAIASLRNDPLLFVLITLLVAAIAVMGSVIAYLFKRNSSLTLQNTTLSKGTIEAVTSIMPIMTYMQEQLKEAKAENKEMFRGYESKVERLVEDLKGHITLLMKIGHKP